MPSGSNGVTGEIFEISNESVWEVLDDYEGVTGGLYQREEIPMALFEGCPILGETADRIGQTPLRVQAYVFCGSRRGFFWHGDSW